MRSIGRDAESWITLNGTSQTIAIITASDQGSRRVVRGQSPSASDWGRDTPSERSRAVNRSKGSVGSSGSAARRRRRRRQQVGRCHARSRPLGRREDRVLTAPRGPGGRRGAAAILVLGVGRGRPPAAHAGEEEHGAAAEGEDEDEGQQRDLQPDAVVDDAAAGTAELLEADLLVGIGPLADGERAQVVAQSVDGAVGQALGRLLVRGLRRDAEDRDRRARLDVEAVLVGRAQDVARALLAAGLDERARDVGRDGRDGLDAQRVDARAAGDVLAHRGAGHDVADEIGARGQRGQVVGVGPQVDDLRPRAVDEDARRGRRDLQLAPLHTRREEADAIDARKRDEQREHEDDQHSNAQSPQLS